MFCIVRCDRCGALQASVHPAMTSRCRTCGRTIDLTKHPPMGTYDKETEMREVLIRLRSSMEKEPEMTSEKGAGENRKMSRSTLRNREERTKYILLCIGNDAVDREVLIRSCEGAGLDRSEIERIIDQLIDQRSVYEPRPNLISRVK